MTTANDLVLVSQTPTELSLKLSMPALRAMLAPPPLPVKGKAGEYQVLSAANSLIHIWPLSASFLAYSVWRKRGQGLFYPVCPFTMLGSWTEQNLPDGETATYRLYGLDDKLGGTLLGEVTATQVPRVYAEAPLIIDRPGQYTGNFYNPDPDGAAVTVKDGVKGWVLHDFRLKTKNHALSLGQGSDGLISNGFMHGLHPGKAGRVHGFAITGYRPAGITAQFVSHEGFCMDMYLNGGKTKDIQRIIFKNWLSWNIQALLTTETGYQAKRGYAGHAFQADQAYSVPVYDVMDGTHIQEWKVGMIEDGISNYMSSGTAVRPFRFKGLCVYGMYPVDPKASVDVQEGYNYGCGIISEGYGTGDGALVGNGQITDNLTIACGNAGLGVAGGSNQEWARNRDICSGQYPDGTTNNATNVGTYVAPNDKATPGTFNNNNLHDNASLHLDRPGSKNKRSGGYYNNAFDFSGCDRAGMSRGNVQANNKWIEDGDQTFAREMAEYATWGIGQALKGVALGAQTIGY